jgi:two-component system, OmpR family, phosphate regulon sensor histidine kinase PhoR
VVEAHGQNIHVRSTLDVGSTFGFTLEARRDA